MHAEPEGILCMTMNELSTCCGNLLFAESGGIERFFTKLTSYINIYHQLNCTPKTSPILSINHYKYVTNGRDKLANISENWHFRALVWKQPCFQDFVNGRETGKMQLWGFQSVYMEAVAWRSGVRDERIDGPISFSAIWRAWTFEASFKHLITCGSWPNHEGGHSHKVSKFLLFFCNLLNNSS